MITRKHEVARWILRAIRYPECYYINLLNHKYILTKLEPRRITVGYAISIRTALELLTSTSIRLRVDGKFITK